MKKRLNSTKMCGESGKAQTVSWKALENICFGIKSPSSEHKFQLISLNYLVIGKMFKWVSYFLTMSVKKD